MFNESPLFKKMMLTFAVYGVAVVLSGLMVGKKLGGSFDFGDFVCLVGISIPLVIIVGSYKLLERSRRSKPPKETVQTLHLDD